MINVFCTRLLKQSYIDNALVNGIKITGQRFIRIEPVLSEELKKNILLQLNRSYLTLLFTSKNAASIVINNFLKEVTEEVTSTWKCYCLSGATKNALLKYFHPEQIIAHANDANALIKKMNIEDHAQPVHFFCGNRRRSALPDFMQQNNIAYKEWIVYKTENSPEKIQDHFNAYLFYSPSAVESFFSKNTLLKDKPCFAIGTTTAAAIKARINNPVYISEKPDTSYMLKLLFRYFKVEE